MQFKKHIHVLYLLSEIPTGKVIEDEACDCWDHIFYYIHEHWAPPMSAKGNVEYRATTAEQTEYLDCKTMLLMSAKELSDKLESLPPYFTESLFPVAVARHLLRWNGPHGLNISPRTLRTFDEFHRRYARMILAE